MKVDLTLSEAIDIQLALIGWRKHLKQCVDANVVKDEDKEAAEDTMKRALALLAKKLEPLICEGLRRQSEEVCEQ